MTDVGAAILSAVNRYGTAFGMRALRSSCTGVAAYERISSTWIGCTWRSPLATLTSTMKYTISVTIRRRGISLVAGYMFTNSETSTMIGIALSATAIGVASSLRMRNRISRNADPTPSNVPASRPTKRVLARHEGGVLDEAEVVEERLGDRARGGQEVRLEVEQLAPSAPTPAGTRCRTRRAGSAPASNDGGEATLIGPRHLRARAGAGLPLDAAQRFANLGDLLVELGLLASVLVACPRRGRRRSGR